MGRWMMASVAWASLFTGGVAAAGSVDAESGYQSAVVEVAPPGAFVGGMEVLPNGNYAVMYAVLNASFQVEDSQVLEVSPSGTVVRPLCRPGKVFGAFLKQDPGDPNTLYFGESTRGNIMGIDVRTGALSFITRAVFPFDLAIGPDGTLALSWAFDFNGSLISIVRDDGMLIDIVQSTQASGGVEFDADGNLYYTMPGSGFPPPANSTEVRRLTASQVECASITNKVWDASEGALLGLVDGGYGLTCDDSGDLFVTDSVLQQVVEIDAETGAEQIVAAGSDFGGAFTYVRWIPGTHGAFERFQPQSGGTLHCVSTDFFSFNQVVRTSPQRPELATSPSGSIPVGAYQLTVTGGVPNGVAVLYLTGGVVGSEFAVNNTTWPAPLFFGLDFSGGPLVTQVLALDGNGEATLNSANDGGASGTFGMQVVTGESASGPLYGTSNAIAVTFE